MFNLFKFSISMILVLLFINGCAIKEDKALRVNGDFVDIIDTESLYVIEFNDKGDYHNDYQKNRFFNDIEKGIIKKDIIIFVHGWHHNADKSDENFTDFKKFLFNVNKKSETKYTGLYIGWRGDLYDPLWSESPIDFPSFMNRKEISVELGENGLKNILNNLDEYIENDLIEKYVAIGHSLGGSALYYSTKDKLDNKDDNKYILLNPALTQDEFRKTSKQKNKISNVPKMILLQAEGDYAIRIAYDLVSWYTNSAGYSSFITHDLNTGNKKPPTKFPEKKECVSFLNNNDWVIRSRTNRDGKGSTCNDANSRISWVVIGKDDSIKSHNDIFNPGQTSALIDILKK